MHEFRFSLEKYTGSSSRYFCPNEECKKKDFTRYVDIETNNYVDETVGKCNRILKCGYHKTPRIFFEENGKTLLFSSNDKSNLKKIVKPIYFINEVQLLESLHNDKITSHFFDFLVKFFDKERVLKVFQKYAVGVSSFWEKSIIFWQIDRHKKIRTGKIMQYNSQTGKRDKKKFNWIKSDETNSEIQQVFFGIHLIDYFRDYKIGIVESEKTALICDLYFDEKIIWIASGGLQGINEKKFEDLIGREVILFPDLSPLGSKISASNIWKSKAKAFGEKYKMNIKVNNYLELFASDYEKENQEDLGDFIIRKLSKKDECVKVF